jgi:hypothetical protein
MATAATRRSRGWQTQNAVARYLRENGFPHAESAGSGRSGSDVLGTPGVAFEVKSRRDLDPLAWLRQAAKGAVHGDVPAVVFRPDGMGLISIDSWPVLLRLEDFVVLLRAAGIAMEVPAAAEIVAVSADII